MVISAGWWLAAVQLTPAADRPFIGGSQDNSLLNVIFGYNGFGRLTGNETGSVGGGPPGGGLGTAAAGGGGGSHWGITGLTRLFGSDMGGRISWLLPAALVFLVAGLVLTLRAPRTDRRRAALVLWGASLVVSGVVFSLGQGIIHPYYTVALAPSIGPWSASGPLFSGPSARSSLRAWSLAPAWPSTAVWSFFLLRRSPTWHPDLRTVVLVAGCAAALGVVVARPLVRSRRAILMSGMAAGVALAAGLAGPAAYTRWRQRARPTPGRSLRPGRP